MFDHDESRRIIPGDCLHELFCDVLADARRLPLYDADARAAWIESVALVLSAVPDRAQRMAWAIELATALPLLLTPILDAAVCLLKRAEARSCSR
jgi:hypothetical protein